MISFVTKKVLTIDKSRLRFDDESELCLQIENLFDEKNCETILIYEGGNYCGYIEQSDKYNIVIPEFYIGFEPVEVSISDELMEELRGFFNKGVKSNIGIPIKDGMEGVRTFAIDKPVSMDLSRYLTEYLRQPDPVFLLEKFPDKKAVIFPEMNELTHMCYRVLRQKKQKYLLKGRYWEWLNVKSEADHEIESEECLEYDDKLIEDLLTCWAKEKIAEGVSYLRNKGIHAYNIILPCYEELAVHGTLEDRVKNELKEIVYLRDRDFPNRQFWMEQLLRTEGCETEEELLYSYHPSQYGEGDMTIYLAGACIVAGDQTTETASIAFMLFQKLRRHGLNYNVKRISRRAQDISLLYELEALDLRENDMLFFITDSWMYQRKSYDIDLLEEFNNRKVDDWWFLNFTIHTLKNANKMIVNKLFELIEESQVTRCDGSHYLQVGRPVLGMDQEIKLRQYFSETGVRKKDGSIVGCIVMNANPFTLGHHYLVEKALEDCDELLVFVVEEDVSDFPFHDRFQMVKKGVAHFDNVQVIPSGKFIISSYTFKSYFESDRRQNEKLDSARDVNLFGAYIAPAFGITKRFIGEEPLDKGTACYNKELKKKLPMYGVEVKEIPRKEINGNIISASIVRELYSVAEWETMSAYLPKTSINYLKDKDIELKIKKRQMKIPNKVQSDLKSVFRKFDKIIFYGMGRDGRGLYDSLTNEEKGKIVFCDKRAEVEEYFIEGKRVYTSQILLQELRSLPIIITSTQFGKTIRNELCAMGVSSTRLIQNTYSFYTGI